MTVPDILQSNVLLDIRYKFPNPGIDHLSYKKCLEVEVPYDTGFPTGKPLGTQWEATALCPQAWVTTRKAGQRGLKLPRDSDRIIIIIIRIH